MKNLAVLSQIQIAAFLAALISSTFVLGAAHAQSKIVALVNDVPVTSYEVNQRAKLLKLTSKNGSKSKALKELIDEALKLQEAKRRGIVPTPQEIERAFASIAGRTKMSADQLNKALAKSGVNAATLKGRLRAEIAWGRVVRARFRSTVKVEEADVIASMRDRQPGLNTIKEFTLKQVIFVVPAGTSKKSDASIKKRAAKFLPTIAGCDAVNAQAEGMRDVVVRNVGRKDETQLPPALVEKLSAVQVSQGTKPSRIKEGYEILVVCDVRDVTSDAAVRDEVRSEIMDKEGQILARRYIRDLRQEAVIDIR